MPVCLQISGWIWGHRDLNLEDLLQSGPEGTSLSTVDPSRRNSLLRIPGFSTLCLGNSPPSLLSLPGRSSFPIYAIQLVCNQGNSHEMSFQGRIRVGF